MCTVTFIPVREKVFITSNRDEKQLRLPAISPSIYRFSTGKILFPKDANAGGSWFAIHENGNAIVFLNGAWEKHEPRHPYKKSRGLILLDLADSENPLQGFQKSDLENVEPFTAIIWQDTCLYECRWDGTEKYENRVNEKLAHIWSSVTLYDENIIARRKSWFTKWLEENPRPSQDDILQFHQFSGEGDQQNDLLMNRNNIVLTVSVTSAAISENSACMKYINTRSQQSSVHNIALHKSIPVK
ncbi:MAG TPA: NRDE family protein [Puia sp.]|nr:NRDE family protein [Puia sp.]